MNEARAPTDEKLRGKVLAEYQAGIKPKALSEKFGISINTIKSWIKRDKSKIRKTAADAPCKKKGAPVTRKRGAQLKNKNAEGAGAPAGNKNAQKHGGYSAVYWDVLTEEELEMIDGTPTDEEVLLMEQIQLFSVRERRIMQAINKYRNAKEPVAISYTSRTESKRSFKDEEEEAKYNRRQQEKIDKEEILPGHSYTIQTSTENKDNIITRLESELSSVQSKKTKAIDSLAKLRLEKQRLDGGNKGNEVVKAWAERVIAARRDSDG